VSANERLYRLLPAIHRVRDAREGEPLRAMLALIQDELDRVEDHVARTYENWFIETCDDWVVPYLGDALGVRGLAPTSDDGSLRAYVANTLRFRQRKGTASVLEDLARTVTGWPAAAIEMVQRLPATQHLNHLDLSRVRTPDLRDGDALERLGGPFETAGHLVDVRSIAARRGRYNIPDIAIWIWRLEAFAVEHSPPAVDPTAGPARFRFSPLGADTPLFGPERSDDSVVRTTELSVPAPIRRRPIWAELEAARAALANGESPHYAYLDPAEPAVRIWEQDGADLVEIPPDRIQICNLSAWSAGLPVPASYVDGDGNPVDARVAVDPVLGRLAFLPDSSPPAAVRVSYRHGFPGPIGGGLYERAAGLDPIGERRRYTVGGNATGAEHATLAAAVAAWTADGKPDAVIAIVDNDEYAAVDLAVPDASSLEVRAADEHRAIVRLVAPWRLTLGENASIVIDGVLVAGNRVELATTGGVAERRFALRHATLVPGHALAVDGSPTQPDAPSLIAVPGATGRLIVGVRRSITGPIDLTEAGIDGSELSVQASIVDAMGGTRAAIAGSQVAVDAATVLGTTRVRQIDGSRAIFDAPITADRTQVGCLRYCYVAPGSRAPRGHKCQPALALAGAPATQHDAIAARLRPRYTARRYGEAAYVQLAQACAAELVRGADDGGELGAWHFLHQPQREDNLAAAIDEYLRIGLEAGVFKAT
jgi:hypothetical protein